MILDKGFILYDNYLYDDISRAGCQVTYAGLFLLPQSTEYSANKHNKPSNELPFPRAEPGHVV